MEMHKPHNVLPEMFRGFFTPINRDGYLFIGIFALAAIILSMLSHWLGCLGWVATLWCVYFFRDPPRVSPLRDGLILSPADGRVCAIERVKILDLGDGEFTRISIFLNVFDVHINRIPASGQITDLHYHHGKFLNASLDKASEDNERQVVKMRLAGGKEIVFVQIAGLVARRIVCHLSNGQQVAAGERFGLIRFGSRMDIYLPQGVEPQVIVGQRAVGGETILADCASEEPARTGVIR
jgi:phosphatidylserine decarboxylase